MTDLTGSLPAAPAPRRRHAHGRHWPHHYHRCAHGCRCRWRLLAGTWRVRGHATGTPGRRVSPGGFGPLSGRLI